MKTDITTIEINGERYVRECDVPDMPAKTDGDYVIIRTHSAGVHAGYLDSRDGEEVVLKNTRRIWQWGGAASLSQLAGKGTSNPKGCKFPAAIDSITLLGVIEIIPCSAKAQKLIEGVPPWVS